MPRASARGGREKHLLKGRCKRQSVFGADVIYDLQSRVSSVQLTFDYIAPSGTFFDPTSYTYTYSEEDDTLSQLMIIGGGGLLATIEPVYDRFGRTTSKVIDFNLGNANAFYNELSYDYKTNGYKESGLVSQVVSEVGQSSTGTLTTTTYNYTYDKNGNITQITDANGVIQNRYEYDDLGQLTREDNRALNKSYAWTYDNAGNITSKKTYPFTIGTLGTATYTMNYTYGNSSWGDQLTSFYGDPITYDAIGNPLTYGDYYAFEWEGRQLQRLEFSEAGTVITYTYNADGIRTSQLITNDGYELREYTLNGTQIVKEEVSYEDAGGGTGIYTLVYIYDETGSPIGMKYREPWYAADVYDCYFFEKNLQGDIVSVYNSSGLKLIAYTYDAWGNFEVSYPNGYSALGGATCNPFKYRGYYYDTETGFYYLQSRYYNPQWGRFINEDAYINANGDIVGFNMFAYCSSNPVVFVDYSGEGTISDLHWPGEIHKAVVEMIGKNNKWDYERGLSFLGRADLIDHESAMIYEVKHWSLEGDATNYQAARIQLALYQIGTYVKFGQKYELGTLEIKGVFIYHQYTVTYWYYDEGIILYDFYETPNGQDQGLPVYVPVAKKKKKVAKSYVPTMSPNEGLAWGVAGASIAGGLLLYTFYASAGRYKQTSLVYGIN